MLTGSAETIKDENPRASWGAVCDSGGTADGHVKVTSKEGMDPPQDHSTGLSTDPEAWVWVTPSAVSKMNFVLGKQALDAVPVSPAVPPCAGLSSIGMARLSQCLALLCSSLSVPPVLLAHWG